MSKVVVFVVCLSLAIHVRGQDVPMVISTWEFSWNATVEAWRLLQASVDLVDSIVQGCSMCEKEPKGCGSPVGYGSQPDEQGETTLDAMIMDGRTMNVGAVGGLRRIKNAIGVAHYVLDYTDHTLLVGDLATEFALMMGFVEESLTTTESTSIWETWKNGDCQPNYRRNVIPDQSIYCGPYLPINPPATRGPSGPDGQPVPRDSPALGLDNHDTIAMIAVDSMNNVAAGTSTNGLRHKIPGRTGDSPIVGAGAYAENGVGAAVSTGNGDKMMRFSPAFLAVERMRQGFSPQQAAQIAVDKVVQYYPTAEVAVMAVNTTGQFGTACGGGYTNFYYTFANPSAGTTTNGTIACA